MRSLLQETKECYLCRKALGPAADLPSEGLEKHHIIYGTGNRKIADREGLWIYLCHYHHNQDEKSGSVHYKRQVREELSQEAERAFLQNHSLDDWMRLFTKNWLDENELKRIKTKQSEILKNEFPLIEPKTKNQNAINAIRQSGNANQQPPEGFYYVEDLWGNE